MSNSPRHFNLSPEGSIYGVANGSRLWLGDTESQQIVKEVRLPGLATSLIFSADDRYVAVGLVRAPWQMSLRWPVVGNMPLADEVVVIEIETGLIRFQKKNLEVIGFGFHPQTQQLYILERNHQTGQKQVTFYQAESWEIEFQHQTGHAQPLAIALSNDGRFLAMPLSDSRVEVWEIEQVGKGELKGER